MSFGQVPLQVMLWDAVRSVTALKRRVLLDPDLIAVFNCTD